MAGESYLREGEANWMRLEAHPEISLREILRENQSDLTQVFTPGESVGHQGSFHIILGLGVPRGSGPLQGWRTRRLFF